VLQAQPWVHDAFLRAGRVIVQVPDRDAVPRLAETLVREGRTVLELVEDTFDLRAYYRERVVAQRVRRTQVDEERVRDPLDGAPAGARSARTDAPEPADAPSREAGR
ncbi:MAG: hypothetical protein WD336_02725, partial [Trueperaceae bacterium]